MTATTERIRLGVVPVQTWVPPLDDDATFRYVDIGSIDRETKSIVAATELPVTEAPSRARQLLRVDDVLISTVRPNLNAVAMVPQGLDGSVGSTGFTVLRANSKRLLPRYLFHWVRTPAFIRDMVKKSTGASYPAISDRIVLDSNMPMPTTDEQRRIADILDKADAIRRKRKEAIALTEELLRSAFLEMFGEQVTNPKGWETRRIDSLCEVIVDCVNRTAPVVLEKTPYKMVRTTNVRSGKVLLDEVKFATQETFEMWNRRCAPRRNDVLLTREAPVGEAGLLLSDDKVFLGQRLMLYRPNRRLLLPEYLVQAFQGPHMQAQFETHCLGSTVKHLALPVCRSLSVRVPPLALQERFAELVRRQRESARKHEIAIAESERLFQTLVDRAFLGELKEAAAAC